MGYTYVCDSCDTEYHYSPPFMGEFSEPFLKTADTPLAEVYSPGQVVTICRSCMEGALL